MSELVHKASRFISRGVSRALLPELNASIISFGFDDCPASAIETALPILEAEGWRATVYVSVGLCGTENHLGVHMKTEDILDVHEHGHEIADHTYSHISSNNVGTREYIADVERNQKALTKLGLPRSRHFAYPFGHVSPSLKQALGKQFHTLRGVLSPTHATQDANLLNAVRIYSGSRLQDALNQIERAKSKPIWLNLFTHDVRQNPSEFGCTPEEFQKIVKAVKESGLRVMTVDDAYRTIEKRKLVS